MILRMMHFPIVWIGLVVMLAILALILASKWAVQANTPTPADLFMQSVVRRDGALGWHQLCSPLQAQMPLSTLVSQVNRQRSAEAGQGLTLTSDYIGAHAQSQGGQIRVYVVTAHTHNGWTGQRTYILYTQPGGCVEDVKIS
jgi:hypothetical protein